MSELLRKGLAWAPVLKAAALFVLALITMITSEMIARQSGAGNILFNALDMGQYDTVFAMIIIVGAMGICRDAIFERVRDNGVLIDVKSVVPKTIKPPRGIRLWSL